ncbi:hypothetical protein [Glycomyces buryatensis]|uniref:ParB/Sulfiredoxin domain-containing protein n=1 Tax=Glycomyces buryatensis TaxID=2570927 RepID=A0A4S8Q9L8_9ACTN|nr:hypothetical protein [Glycomyces buryatensis]THV40930.1 hypothetical protein FAB82_13860 [Glycomyces buryatensis]
MPFGDPAAFRTVDVPDGLGAIAIEGSGHEFTLKLAGDPIAQDAAVESGSIEWMAKRLSGPHDPVYGIEEWLEPPEWDALRQWLRHVEPGDDPTVPLRPLLNLLAPGLYEVGIATLPKPFIVGTEPDKLRTWYAGMEDKRDQSAIVPVHHWSPRPDVVAEYKDRCSTQRANPASVVLTHPDSEVYYLLDGHHKLAAYMEAGRDPLCVVIELNPDSDFGYPDHLNEPSTEYRVEIKTRGDGLLSVVGKDGASALRIAGEAYVVEGYTDSGSCDRLAVRSGDPRFRKRMRRLSQWLREPDPGSAAEMTRTVWKLLAPGRYGLRRWVPRQYYVEPFHGNRYARWYDGISTPCSGTALIPTDQWPPANGETVSEYRRMIRDGARPLVLTLRASPPEAENELEEDCVAFVIDGHHKLAAYREAGIAPHCLDIAKLSDEVACAPRDLRDVLGGDEVLTANAANLMRWLRSPHRI